MECPDCGFPIDPTRSTTCPKCGSTLSGSARLGMLEVDVVHSGEDWEEAARKIEAAVDQAVHRGHKGVKIIHGHGSATGRSALAPRAMTYMRHLAEVTGGRFTRDRNNPGASIIWLNR